MTKPDSDVWADSLIEAINLNASYEVKIDDEFFREWFAEAWRHGLRDVDVQEVRRLRGALEFIIWQHDGMYPYDKAGLMAETARRALAGELIGGDDH